jgi:hypothetical protein
MRAVPFALGFLCLGIVVAVWVANCSGPQPIVESTEVHEPEHPGEPYRVLAVVRNAGPGQGETRVTFRLRDPGSNSREYPVR